MRRVRARLPRRGTAGSRQSAVLTTRSRGRRSRRGQAIAELAIIAPILLILLAAAVDLGRLFYSQITMANAAREGALAASQDPSNFEPGQDCVYNANPLLDHGPAKNRVMCAITNESIQSSVVIKASGVTMSCDGVVVATKADAANCGRTLSHSVTIALVGQFTLVTPLLSVFTGSQTIALSSAATSVPRELPPTPPPAPTPTPTPTPTLAPTPTPTPTPDPLATPTPTPVPTPTPTPTPVPTPTPTLTPSCYAPVADFTWSPNKPRAVNETVQFMDQSTHMTLGQCGAAWTWTFGDTYGDTVQNPLHIYAAEGTYTIKLLVTNSAGSNSKQMQITVKKP